MATEEVGIRLSLQGRREAAAGLSSTSRELEGVAESAQDVDAAARDAARGLEKATDRRFAKGFAAIGRGARGVAGVLGKGLVTGAKAGAYGLGVTAVAAAGLSVKAIGLASDAAETGSAFSTVLGPAAKGVQKDLDRLTNRFGIYNTELQGAATGFATLGKQAGARGKDLSKFSTSLVRAGLDLGSFYNASPEEAFGAIQSGLTGEAESLKRFNIFMSDAALNAFALKQGLTETTQEMTEQEKVALRQSFILAHLGDAQGDLARTSEGFANQQRGATGRTRELLKLLGGPLMTAGTGAFQGLNSVLRAGIRELRANLPAVEAGAQRLSDRLARLGKTWAQDLPGAIDRLSARWTELKVNFASFTAGDTSTQMGTLKDNVLALGPAIAAAKEQLPGISDALGVMNVVTGFLAKHTETLADWMPVLAAGFLLLKASQIVANLVAAASLPLKVAEVVATRQLVKANKELVAAQGASKISTLGGAAASGVATGATGAQAGAQRGLNAAMRANPIGAIITVLTLLVGGIVLAYNKSETFRNIIDGLWGAIKTAAKWVADLAVKVGTFLLKWTPMGAAISLVKDKFDSVGDAVSWVIDKLKAAWDWIGKVAGAASDIPGVGLLGDIAGGIGNLNPFAHGGMVTAGAPIQVGERGTETFLPAVPGVIMPNFTTTPDVDEMFGDDTAPPAEQHLHLYIDGREVEATVTRSYEKKLARA